MSREGDIVLIHYEDQPSLYARIESIEADIKKEWYQVTLLLLTIPSQVITWILREEYINGAPFTMGGRSMMLKEVKRVPPPPMPEPDDQSVDSNKGKKGKVINFKVKKEK